MVRETMSRSRPGSRVSALGAPSGMNSAYASSTNTIPRDAEYTASMVSIDSGVPVGLFGAQRNTRSGSSRSTAATAVSGEIANPASRSAVTHSVPVPAAMIGCIEYVGGKPSTRRPGPPKACSTCWMISFDPLAAQIWLAVSPWPR
jgi:hypothetical protein